MSENFSCISLVVLAVSVLALTGCGKVKGVVGKLTELKSEVVSTTSAAALPGNYRRDQVSEVSKASYDSFIARKDALVIVDFHAEWCPPCKMLGPVLVKATEAHPGVVYVGKVNVDQASDLAGPLGVSSIPDVRIFKNGVQVDRFVGFPGEAQVLAKISELSAGIQPAPATPAAATAAPAAESTIKPFEKGWLPPGVTRQGQPRPAEPGPSAKR